MGSSLIYVSPAVVMPPPEEEGGKTQINGFQDLSSHGRKSGLSRFRSNFVVEGGEKERVGGFFWASCAQMCISLMGRWGREKGA